MNSIQRVKLNDGNEIPLVALGTGGLSGLDCYNVVLVYGEFGS
jgi:hypothetical protein